MQRLNAALTAGLLVAVLCLIFVVKLESDQTQEAVTALAASQHQ